MNELIKDFLLENEGELKSIVDELNSYNSNCDYLEFYENDEEFFECFFNEKIEIARAIAYGNYNYTDEYVTFDSYGNLVTYTEYEIIETFKDNIDDIVENIILLKDEIGLYNEIIDEIKNDFENEIAIMLK